jgi:replication factor A1
MVAIDITLWGQTALSFDPNFEGVVAVKGARVSDYRGKRLFLTSSSSIEKEPDITEVYLLIGW